MDISHCRYSDSRFVRLMETSRVIWDKLMLESILWQYVLYGATSQVSKVHIMYRQSQNTPIVYTDQKKTDEYKQKCITDFENWCRVRYCGSYNKELKVFRSEWDPPPIRPLNNIVQRERMILEWVENCMSNHTITKENNNTILDVLPEFADAHDDILECYNILSIEESRYWNDLDSKVNLDSMYEIIPVITESLFRPLYDNTLHIEALKRDKNSSFMLHNMSELFSMIWRKYTQQVIRHQIQKTSKRRKI
jgi:hypothetical protein